MGEHFEKFGAQQDPEKAKREVRFNCLVALWSAARGVDVVACCFVHGKAEQKAAAEKAAAEAEKQRQAAAAAAADPKVSPHKHTPCGCFGRGSSPGEKLFCRSKTCYKTKNYEKSLWIQK